MFYYARDGADKDEAIKAFLCSVFFENVQTLLGLSWTFQNGSQQSTLPRYLKLEKLLFPLT